MLVFFFLDYVFLVGMNIRIIEKDSDNFNSFTVWFAPLHPSMACSSCAIRYFEQEEA
jgi:hypothetical protein